MRTVSVDLNTHFGLPETSYTFFLLITPRNGTPEGYTAHDVSHTIDGVTYDAESSNAPTRIPTRLKLNVDALETQMLFGAGSFDVQKLKLGYYTGARFRMFAANYEGDLTDQVTLMAGTLGKASIEDDRAALIELQSLSASANQPHGKETAPLCWCPRFGRSYCRNAIDDGEGYAGGLDDGPDVADFTEAGTVTHVTSASQFRLSGLTSLIGWNDARFLGIVRATSGANFNTDTAQGVEEVVKSYNTGNGEVRLRVPLPYVPEIGDTFDCERGCDKAYATCVLQPNRVDAGADDGEGNYANFRGFPFLRAENVTKKQK